MGLILPLLISILVTLLCHVLYKRVEQFRLFRNLKIPGPVPSIFTGNMREIRGGKSTPMEVMNKWESLYGNIYGYYVGVRPILVVRDLEIIREMFIKNWKNFIDRPHLAINADPITKTVVGLRGTRWKEVRAMLSPIFSTAKMRHMVPFMTQSVSTTLSIIGQKCDEGAQIDVYKLFQGLTCDVICGCALAMKVNSQRDENDKFLVAIKGFLTNAMSCFVKVALCFPLIAKMAEWGLTTFGYSHEMTLMIMQSVKTAIELRRRRKKEVLDDDKALGERKSDKEGKSSHFDVLQFMLESDEFSVSSGLSDGSNKDFKPLSDDEIIANSWVFILGGFETTAAALTFSSYLLSQHQHVQLRLFNEIQQAFREDEIPTYDQIGKLKYLDQVISESLRLYPPVVSFVSRRVEEDVKIGPYKVPAGVNIQIPLWQIHHDPELWPEPYTFDPERFSQSARKSHNSLAFIPFGIGPRSCIGVRFALLEIKFGLAMILRKFKILPSTNATQSEPKLIVPTVSIVPADGIPLTFERRSIENSL